MLNKESLTDLSVGTTAATVPFWLNQVEAYLQLFMLVGGSILLIMRLVLAGLEWRARRNVSSKQTIES